MIGRCGALLTLVFVLAGCGGEESEDQATSTPTATPAAEATATRPPTLTPRPTSTPAPTSTPRPVPTPIAGNRLRIPSLNVDAALTLEAVSADGQLPEPDTPDDVVMYDFAVFQGLGGVPGSGNAVVAGDFNSWSFACQDGTQAPPCSGVFWFLDELSAGDTITIEWDGQSYDYVVENLCWIDAALNFEPLVLTTAASTLTLITAAGAFDFETDMFTHRLVVRASVRGTTHSLACGAGSSSPLPKERFTDTVDEVYAVQASPLIRGEDAVVVALSELGAVCYAELRQADGRPVFYVPMDGVGGGSVVLQWRVWERLEVGSYDLSVDCGGAAVTVSVTVADGEIRRY